MLYFRASWVLPLLCANLVMISVYYLPPSGKGCHEGAHDVESAKLPLHPQKQYLHNYEIMSQDRIAQYRGFNGPKYTILVTGAAGFIGMHTCLELKRLGHTPIGYDNVNSYYAVKLKEKRLGELQKNDIAFVKADVCDTDALKMALETHGVTRVIHLAAQAGVRYSLDHPLEYAHNNIDCMIHLLETLNNLGLKETFVYASSSSVYGNNNQTPFLETHRVEDPASLYATTKRSDELVAQTYFNLYNISSIGLRFFTVYGPFGRPDMAPWIFTDKIYNNNTIKVFNHGKSQRDFTFVGDIVQGVVNSLYVASVQPELVNLGNGHPIVLADFVRIVEEKVGIQGIKVEVGMQKGDVPVTYANIDKARWLLGYNPNTPIEEGIEQFVAWFRANDAGQYKMGSA